MCNADKDMVILNLSNLLKYNTLTWTQRCLFKCFKDKAVQCWFFIYSKTLSKECFGDLCLSQTTLLVLLDVTDSRYLIMCTKNLGKN